MDGGGGRWGGVLMWGGRGERREELKGGRRGGIKKGGERGRDRGDGGRGEDGSEVGREGSGGGGVVGSGGEGGGVIPLPGCKPRPRFPTKPATTPPLYTLIFFVVFCFPRGFSFFVLRFFFFFVALFLFPL